MDQQMSAEELESLQQLSDTYEPNVAGPCVSTRQPMDVLTAQFEMAAQQYVNKVASLARSHAEVRLVKGDGKCGWRAVVFGYFELLLQRGDVNFIAHEKNRLMEFNVLFPQVGLELTMAELFTEETMDLFDMIKNRVDAGNRDENLIMNVFNDTTPTSKADSIIYHFKLMTSTYMKLNASLYEGFLEAPVEEYCAAKIEATNQEIEQPGLFALATGVIAPGGFGLEVLYLDQSEGDDVTPYNFVPDGQPRLIITLLYRPGHYDMLYKNQFQVHSVHELEIEHQLRSTQSAGITPADLANLSALDNSLAVFDTSNPGASNNWGQQHSSNFLGNDQQMQCSMTPTIPISQISADVHTTPHLTTARPDPFRMSLEMFRQRGAESQTYLPTEPFRNSPFNMAHFHNENFQPIIYNPSNQR